MEDFKKIKEEINNQLKDFQLETVNQVEKLFESGNNRVLVADEVGMGKTIVARGVISRIAFNLSVKDKNKKIIVAYICTNQSIARQNIEKLSIQNNRTFRIENTRLSMQHLAISKINKTNDSLFIIPMTPDTSFNMNGGYTKVQERLLMYAVLKKCLPKNDVRLAKIETIFKKKAIKSWEESVERKKDFTYDIDQYDKDVLNSIVMDIKNDGILDDLDKYNIDSNVDNNNLIKRFKKIFCKISTKLLEPDLVILDEFQRFFKTIIQNDGSNDETKILVDAFFNREKPLKMLLLSATPFKQYSTLDEISEDGFEASYKEFFGLTDFLFNDNKNLNSELFKKQWKEYTDVLKNIKIINFNEILDKKRIAEKNLYSGMLRTERNSVMGDSSYVINHNFEDKFLLDEADIKAYLQISKLYEQTQEGKRVNYPIEFIKSTPYVLSFARKYVVTENIRNTFGNNINGCNTLFVNTEKLKKYKFKDYNNARLKAVMDIAFGNNAETMLWIPPSISYYKLETPFDNKDDFSKVILFSKWDMVPKMVSCLFSYEAERRLTERMPEYSFIYKRKKNDEQFEENTTSKKNVSFYYHDRLRFQSNNTINDNLLSLLYPSKELANLYNPCEYLNSEKREEITAQIVVDDISKKIRVKIEQLIIDKKVTISNNKEDSDWYFYAPLLLDGVSISDWKKDVQKALEKLSSVNDNDKSVNNSLIDYINRIEEKIRYKIDANNGFGALPKDLSRILSYIAVGSPACCIYRTMKDQGYATVLANRFRMYYNSSESTAAVDVIINNDDDYWKKVLKYNIRGCFQSMFDEFYFMLKPFAYIDNEMVFINIYNSLILQTANYVVDNKKTFGNNDTKNSLKVRTHYAVSFARGIEKNDKEQNRREDVRNVFNSPLRPFVLSSTSIGQEGLDFHYYCRKIVHWNLPYNPIDLEQREGRINRYMCFAIRKSIVNDCSNIDFKADVWKELVEEAIRKNKKNHISDLIPFWVYGENQKYKIERIIPMYPLSRDVANLDWIMDVISTYHLALGQPNQEQLLKTIKEKKLSNEELKQIFINLSPIAHKN